MSGGGRGVAVAEATGETDRLFGGAKEARPDELPANFVAKLTELVGCACEQRLLRGRYGVTAFDFSEPPLLPSVGDVAGAAKRTRHVAVLSHGIGTRKDITFGGHFRRHLVEAGYSVLAYSFHGHGWSYAGDEVAPVGSCCGCTQARYDKDIMITQLKELLDHVLDPGEPVDLWVGHSTGCLVGVLAAAEGAWPIRRFALISPAFWAVKPAIAQVVDHLHPVSTALVTNSDMLLKLVEQEYLKNADNAFGHDGHTYFFPEKLEEAKEGIKEKFRLHPQAAKAILAINMTFLRGDLLPKHREVWKEFLQKGGAHAPQTLLVWGDHDIVVPFKHAQEVVSWNPDRVHLTPLENRGHESTAEDPDGILKAIVDYFGVPGA